MQSRLWAVSYVPGSTSGFSMPNSFEQTPAATSSWSDASFAASLLTLCAADFCNQKTCVANGLLESGLAALVLGIAGAY